MIKNTIQTSGRTIYFFTGVKHKTVAVALREIDTIAYSPKNKKKEVEMILCSTGGSCESGFAFYDLMTGFKKDIALSVIATGEIASSSVNLLLAADFERRFITQNGTIFLHEVEMNDETGITMNDRGFTSLSSEFQELIKNNQKTSIDIIAKRTGLKKKKILKMMRKKRVLTADEAVKYRFVSKIIPS